jgi:hypothetical protein
MDTTDSEISFDEHGVCSFCTLFEKQYAGLIKKAIAGETANKECQVHRTMP